ncbi:hypothetical protein KVR01_013257 [Diaporthe batatas]|uniref:uncharacterized protein n=1 Tax=Diaporthe batatas TaxID=748121 RepID=UPI001D03A5EC|nr:uncharacterized protein KVR01_013257 [Diaporthe batatas]KAG8156844.1 hypothetical protein KVR01_013257 [Diaporthe batatas]
MQDSKNLLLGFPREIRDAIYAFSFGDFPLPRKVVCWPYPEYLQGVSSIPTPPDYDRRNKITNTSILRTCRQIRLEAFAVMIKTHKLVRISVVNALLSPHLIGSMLYIVPLSEQAFASYPGFIMTHNIEGEQDEDSDGPARRWSFALPSRDLGMFCRAVASGHAFCLNAQCQIRHRITMHDPFNTTCSPDWMCLKNQTEYLKPYSDWLGGAAHFHITGKVDANLAASLTAEIQTLPAVDITKMLNKYTRMDATGQRHLLGRGLARFSRACLKALTEVSRLVETDAWLERGPGGRPNQLVRGVRDMFNILSREHGGPQWEDTQEDHTWHMSRAIQAAASLLAERPPSAAQKSSVYYRNARAHRQYSGSPEAAEAMLGLALDMVAGEGFENWKEQCLEEVHEVSLWKEVRNEWLRSQETGLSRAQLQGKF